MNRAPSIFAVAIAFALSFGPHASGEPRATKDSAPGSDRQSEAARLHDFLQETFERELRRSPVLQTLLGRKDDYGATNTP